jgi:hypothetical protein
VRDARSSFGVRRQGCQAHEAGVLGRERFGVDQIAVGIGETRGARAFVLRLFGR